MAIIPFDVPAKFAGIHNHQEHYGVRLAKQFQQEFLKTGEVQIVEVFNRKSWPGKTEDFFAGNYQAIQYAYNAGYDLVLVGHMEEIRNEEEFVVFTKLIDTAQGITVWSSKTTAFAKDKEYTRYLAAANLATQRPDLFYFRKQTDLLTACTVNEMIHSDVVP